MIKYLEKPDVILTMLVIIDILLILGSVLFKLGPEYITFILLFDAIVCIVLIIEFIRKLQKSENRRMFFRKNWLALLASLPVALLILPFLSYAAYAYPLIVLLRILNLILLIKVISKVTERFLDATYLDKIIAVFIVLLLGSTFVLYCFDPNITSIFQAVWFVFQTITTVGYGDIIPSSPAGQFIGLVLIIAGVLMFSMVTASFGYLFTEKIFKDENVEFNQKANANVEFNQKANAIKENLHETRFQIDEIKEKAVSNERGLEKINERLDNLEENTNNLTERIDYLIEIIDKK